MIDITKGIQSLTTFRRRSGDFVKQLKKNKRLVVLTVKGLSLEEQPNRCPVTLESDKLTHLLYGNRPHIYRAIYRIWGKQKRVEVLHIRRGARRRFKGSDVA